MCVTVPSRKCAEAKEFGPGFPADPPVSHMAQNSRTKRRTEEGSDKRPPRVETRKLAESRSVDRSSHQRHATAGPTPITHHELPPEGEGCSSTRATVNGQIPLPFVTPVSAATVPRASALKPPPGFNEKTAISLLFDGPRWTWTTDGARVWAGEGELKADPRRRGQVGRLCNGPSDRSRLPSDSTFIVCRVRPNGNDGG